jgi:hypothetical protein
MWLPGGDRDQGYWADPVTVHEHGHWAMRSFSAPPSEGGTHVLGAPVYPGMAWSEGFATWFSSDLRDSPIFYDKQNGSVFWLDLSARSYSGGARWRVPVPSAGLMQLMDENEVAAMLWSLRNSSSGAADQMYAAFGSERLTAGRFPRGYTAHYWTELDASGNPVGAIDTRVPAPFLADFLDALMCAGFSRAAMDAATQPASRYPYPSGSPLCR